MTHHRPRPLPASQRLAQADIPSPRTRGPIPTDRYGWDHSPQRSIWAIHPRRRRPLLPLRTIAAVGLLVSALTAGATTASLEVDSHHDTGSSPTSGSGAVGTSVAPHTLGDSAAAETEAQHSTSGAQVCGKTASTTVAGGQYLVQNNEWGANDGQCITANDTGFSVDTGNHHTTNAPASFPSAVSGCWQNTCTRGTTLPAQISQLGPISSSLSATIPARTKTNVAYDIWADHSAKKTGQNNATELMIWLKEQGGIQPIGSKTGTAQIGGANYDVWKGTNGGVNVISYIRQRYVDSADNLPITDFVKDAVKQGSVKDSDYLTNIQAGFEPWQGGPGLKLTNFSVDYGGPGASSGTARTPTAAVSTPTGTSTSTSTASGSGAAITDSSANSADTTASTTGSSSSHSAVTGRSSGTAARWFCPTWTDAGDPQGAEQAATPTSDPPPTDSTAPTPATQELRSPEYERLPGMGTCTEGTTLPARIGGLGPITSSIAATLPAGTKTNLAYDIWADSTPRKTGQNDTLELMIWLREDGGIDPIGQKSGTATIGGAAWDVWTGENGGVAVISYVRQGYVDSADALPITAFVSDAVKQGVVSADAYLTNIQAGFEPWTGGPGLSVDDFSVEYGSAAG